MSSESFRSSSDRIKRNGDFELRIREVLANYKIDISQLSDDIKDSIPTLEKNAALTELNLIRFENDQLTLIEASPAFISEILALIDNYRIILNKIYLQNLSPKLFDIATEFLSTINNNAALRRSEIIRKYRNEYYAEDDQHQTTQSPSGSQFGDFPDEEFETGNLDSQL